MLYIGHFYHFTNQQEDDEENRRHGEFHLIVGAESTEAAIAKFRERILHARENSDLFPGRGSIYFTQLLEFDQFPANTAMMLNFKSVVGDPNLPFIRCITPTEEANRCKIHSWDDNTPQADGKKEELFLEFTD